MNAEHTDDPDAWFECLDAWQYAEVIGLRKAARQLTSTDSRRFPRNRVLPMDADSLLEVLKQAVVIGILPAFAAWTWDDMGSHEPLAADAITPHTRLTDDTTVRIEDLVRWCNAKGIPHNWPDASASQPSEQARAEYPAELRAAIESFNAMHGNPSATAKRSPKAALLAWLEENKPELSANARERVATVANWQPTGGAPKTPDK
jgi:hypothetical protein